ncbi:MAG: prolyl oligopeptidase family serine peptidase [Coxiellaceae bacterium]|nr:prolyl oligopeptidase family serine peptidase [Coxiellaceae bacterium]
MRTIEAISELQEVTSKTAQQWVRSHNKNTRTHLDKTATFRKLYRECQLTIKKNKVIDDIWLSESGFYQRIFTDKNHPKGLLQEIDKKSYLSENPEWETVLDIDAFAKEKNVDLAFSKIYESEFNGKIVSIIGFSEAGSDAFLAYEFNIKTKKFVSNGFSLPKARSDITWYSRNSLLVATDCGENSLTHANYPRSIRLLNRNKCLQEAVTVFEIDPSHMMTISLAWYNGKNRYLFYVNHMDFYHSEFHLVSKKNPRHYNKLPIPTDAQLVDIYQNTALIQLHSDWVVDKIVFKKNAIIGLDLKKFRQNPRLQPNALNLRLWYQADAQNKIETIFCSNNNVYVFVLNNLQMQICLLMPSSKSIRQKEIPLPKAYSFATPLFIDEDEKMFFHFETFLQPKTLYAYDSKNSTLALLKSGTPYFDASRYFVRRLAAISKDGTKIPYHIVTKKNLPLNGLNPTILRGYGGFEDYLNPSYLRSKVVALLEKGFVYVHAHIRGGGEFGSEWHKMGSNQYKQNSFDDFIAVAEDLINLKITSPAYLGIQGESNGGLLVAACMTQRPALFGAVFCDVAVLDMLHYHQLFAGQSWVAEYGNPDDPAMHSILAKYSPLHNLDTQKNYPKIFMQSSKTDDRVHPYHARAMTHQLEQLKKPVFYYEKKGGGHTGTSFEECMRVYTYWHLRLLAPAQRERKRQREENNGSTAGFFQAHERHAPHRRLEKRDAYAAKRRDKSPSLQR